MDFTAIYSPVVLNGCILPPIDRERPGAQGTEYGAIPHTELRSQEVEMDVDDDIPGAQADAAGTRAYVESRELWRLRSSPDIMQFCDFVLVPRARLLLRHDTPVDIGSRAFDLLVVLAEHRGQLVSKQTIVSFVWPTTLVDESNLRFQMVLLRRIFGSHRHLIKTIPGRGYLLAMDGPFEIT